MVYTSPPYGAGIIRDADGAAIPCDLRNTDWQTYQAWFAAGNVPAPASTPSAPVPTCLLWQLETICNAPPASLGFTPPTWNQVKVAITALASAAVTAFFNVGANSIRADSKTLCALAAATPMPLSAIQIAALIGAADQISIP